MFFFAMKNKYKMSTRFRKTKTIAPGVRLNVGKTGLSTTIGKQGRSISVGKRGLYTNVGIPGTGLSHRVRVGDFKPDRRSIWTNGGCLSWLFVFMLFPRLFGLGACFFSEDKVFSLVAVVVPSAAIMAVCYYFFKRKQQAEIVQERSDTDM